MRGPVLTLESRRICVTVTLFFERGWSVPPTLRPFSSFPPLGGTSQAFVSFLPTLEPAPQLREPISQFRPLLILFWTSLYSCERCPITQCLNLLLFPLYASKSHWGPNCFFLPPGQRWNAPWPIVSFYSRPFTFPVLFFLGKTGTSHFYAYFSLPFPFSNT